MSELEDFLWSVAGGDDEVGLPRRRRRRARRQRRKDRRSSRRNRGTEQTRPPFTPSPDRQLPLPLGTVTMAAAAAGPPVVNTPGRLAVVVQKPGEYDRLSLTPRDVAGALTLDAAEAAILVTDIRIGVESQLSGIDSLSLAMFGSRATGSNIATSVARTGVTVSVDMENQSTTAAILVTGAFVGTNRN